MGEPVTVGPVLFDVDAVAISRMLTQKLQLQVLDNLSDCVQSTALMAALISATVVGVFMVVLIRIERWIQMSDCRCFEYALHAIWRIYAALIDQEGHKPHLWSHRLLWLFFMCSTLVFVFGYILNLLSVDMVAARQLPVVVNVEDYMDEQGPFRDHKVYMMKNLPLYRYLATSKSGILHDLYMKMSRFAGESIISTDDIHEMFQLAMTTLDDLHKNKAIVMIEWQIYQAVLMPGMCCFRSDVASIFYYSHKFAQGTVNFFWRRGVDRDIERRYEYNARMFGEALLWKGIASNWILHQIRNSGLPTKESIYKCMEREKRKPATVLALKLTALHSVLQLSGIALAFAFFAFICEQVCSRLAIMTIVKQIKRTGYYKWMRKKRCKLRRNFNRKIIQFVRRQSH